MGMSREPLAAPGVAWAEGSRGLNTSNRALAAQGPVSISDERLDFVLSAASLGYWEIDPNTRELLFVSDIYRSNWGYEPGQSFTYQNLLAAIHPDDRERHESAVALALATRDVLDIEYRVLWPNGSEHWLRVRGRASYDAQGRPVRMAGTSFDITRRKQLDESLIEETKTLEILNRVGEALNRNLELEHIVQAVTDAATQLSGAQFGAFFHNVINDKGESYLLYTLSGAPRSAFEQFPMPRNTAVFDPTFQGSGVIRSDDIRKDSRYGKNEPHFGMPKGHLPVVSYLAVPVVSHRGEVLGGLFFGHKDVGVFTPRAERIVVGIAAQAAIAMDNARLLKQAQNEIAERRRAERHQQLLLAELNHRVKNTLAVVMSIATNTLRHSRSPEVFRNSFEARILALAEAHDMLSESNWEGASIDVLIDRALKPYRGASEPRYTIEGDRDIRIAPKQAVGLVIAVNELATNAVKYGSLSKPEGRVAIAARRDSGKLRITWEESGGPPVRQPTRQGFGSRLIKGLSQDLAGEVTMKYERDGLKCVFEIPSNEEATS
jgi:PAS domain S-box-containing protein